jgi:hypothetical protein
MKSPGSVSPGHSSGYPLSPRLSPGAGFRITATRRRAGRGGRASRQSARPARKTGTRRPKSLRSRCTRRLPPAGKSCTTSGGWRPRSPPLGARWGSGFAYAQSRSGRGNQVRRANSQQGCSLGWLVVSAKGMSSLLCAQGDISTLRRHPPPIATRFSPNVSRGSYARRRVVLAR